MALTKPNKTSTLVRNVLKDLGSDIKLCPNGYPIGDLTFPCPSAFNDSKKFAVAYCAYNLARKREMEKPSTLQMRNALEKWAESERRCQWVNLTGWWKRPRGSLERARLDSLFQRVRAILSEVLMEQWPVLEFDPTGGATATTERKYAFRASKVDGTPNSWQHEPHKCVAASKSYLLTMLSENPGVARRFMRARDKLTSCFDLEYNLDWSSLEDLADWLCHNTPSAKFAMVPKDYKQVRLIAQSNTLSIMVQKTIGDCIRRALKRVNIDLDDQTINQEWAEIGSHTGLVATVDLSAASDSISLRMVELFPERFRSYFLNMRDTHVEVEGRRHKLAMIAGMGNGYIFELESLLFYAITKAVVEEAGEDTSLISVYGDDIIVPFRCVTRLTEVFLSKGFLINNDKSYSTGPFRESCGKHFFNGSDVTPWYIKSDLDDCSELYHHFNGLTEWSNRTGYPLVRSLKQMAQAIPENRRNLVPQNWSTKSGLHYPCEGVLVPVPKWNRAYHAWEIKYNALVPKRKSIADRVPERQNVLNSLLSLETKKSLFDNENLVFGKLFSHLRTVYDQRGYSVSLFSFSNRVLESTDTTLYWETGLTWKKQGDVSHLGDA